MTTPNIPTTYALRSDLTDTLDAHGITHYEVRGTDVWFRAADGSLGAYASPAYDGIYCDAETYDDLTVFSGTRASIAGTIREIIRRDAR